jgi:hypothetical protein
MVVAPVTPAVTVFPVVVAPVVLAPVTLAPVTPTVAAVPILLAAVPVAPVAPIVVVAPILVAAVPVMGPPVVPTPPCGGSLVLPQAARATPVKRKGRGVLLVERMPRVTPGPSWLSKHDGRNSTWIIRETREDESVGAWG